MCTKSVKFGLDQALHHLLCMRTGKPMPYIIKAKWYVWTVCSHRHSSGGNSSCMAPTNLNLFWALSICHQCPTCSAAWKCERKIYWSFPGSAHQTELLRCLGRREWCATSANWKVPRWKSRVATLSRIHQALVEHFSRSSYRCQLDPPGSRWLLRKPTRLRFLLVSARSPPPPPLSLSLSPPQNTYLSLYFSFLHLFSFINVCPFAKVTKPFCNPLWWMHECVCGINFIFAIEVLCSIACWLRSEPPFA